MGEVPGHPRVPLNTYSGRVSLYLPDVPSTGNHRRTVPSYAVFDSAPRRNFRVSHEVGGVQGRTLRTPFFYGPQPGPVPVGASPYASEGHGRRVDHRSSGTTCKGDGRGPNVFPLVN